MVWVVAPLLFRWKLPCPVRLERLPASMAETAYASILSQMDLEICTFKDISEGATKYSVYLPEITSRGKMVRTNWDGDDAPCWPDASPQ